MKRSAAEETVQKLGGLVKKSVVKDLSYLVTNDTESGSAKNKKAQGLGIAILDEEAFLALLRKPAAIASPGQAPSAGVRKKSAATGEKIAGKKGSGKRKTTPQGELF